MRVSEGQRIVVRDEDGTASVWVVTGGPIAPPGLGGWPAHLERRVYLRRGKERLSIAESQIKGSLETGAQYRLA